MLKDVPILSSMRLHYSSLYLALALSPQESAITQCPSPRNNFVIVHRHYDFTQAGFASERYTVVAADPDLDNSTTFPALPREEMHAMLKGEGTSATRGNWIPLEDFLAERRRRSEP